MQLEGSEQGNLLNRFIKRLTNKHLVYIWSARQLKISKTLGNTVLPKSSMRCIKLDRIYRQRVDWLKASEPDCGVKRSQFCLDSRLPSD